MLRLDKYDNLTLLKFQLNDSVSTKSKNAYPDWKCCIKKETKMSRGILEKARSDQFHENSFSISRGVTFRRTERGGKTKILFI